MLARMMRKMTAMSGEKVPGEVDEMIRRMEAGEDPEKLEGEYGDAMENFDPMGAAAAKKARARSSRPASARCANRAANPTLYEMSEFVDEPETRSTTNASRTRKRPARVSMWSTRPSARFVVGRGARWRAAPHPNPVILSAAKDV